MYKKRYGILAILLCLLFAFPGCAKSEPVAETYAPEPIVETEPEIVTVIDESEPVNTKTEVVSEKPAPVQEEAKGDPKLEPLEVTEEWAKANQLVCLYRNGKLYSLGPYIPVESMEKWIIGQKVDNERAALFMVKNFPGNDFTNDVMEFGPVPTIILEEGDEIRDYNGHVNQLIRYEYVGYTPTIWLINGYDNLYFYEFYNSLEPIEINSNNIDITNVEIKDSNGSSINVRDWPTGFELNEEYTLSYYIGVDYYEFKLWSDSSVYSQVAWALLDDSAYEYTKEGYRSIVDFSSLEPGVYAWERMTIPIELE